MSDCKPLEEARQRKDRIVADYRDVADQAATCLDEGFESATGVIVFCQVGVLVLREVQEKHERGC